jgi:hypothetical protein
VGVGERRPPSGSVERDLLMQLFLDLESRGVVDLRKVGVYAYAEH